MIYEITSKCGHTWEVNIGGSQSYQEYMERRYTQGLCPECEEKKRQERHEKNKELAEEMGLPSLLGSERQVSWAEDIRQEALDGVFEYAKDAKAVAGLWSYANIEQEKRIKCISHYCTGKNKYGREVYDLKKLAQDVIDILMDERRASFWIDHRTRYPSDFLIAAIEQLPDKILEGKKKIPEDVVIEGLLAPENVRYDGRVEITQREDYLEARYAKNDEFREIVKKHDLYWDWERKCWSRRLGITTGSFDDRAAELGHDLLEAGFSVYLPAQAIREKAISATYEPECKRWILEWEDKVKILTGGDETLYQESRGIPGAYWEKGCGLLVPAMQYKAILDFAESYDYQISSAARELMEKEAAIEESAEVVSVETAKKPMKQDMEGLRKILKKNDTILDDLVDD